MSCNGHMERAGLSLPAGTPMAGAFSQKPLGERWLGVTFWPGMSDLVPISVLSGCTV